VFKQFKHKEIFMIPLLISTIFSNNNNFFQIKLLQLCC